MNKYRIIECKGHYRVQQQKYFLWFHWWEDTGYYTPNGGYHAPVYFSLELAEKVMQELEERDERLNTPWVVVK